MACHGKEKKNTARECKQSKRGPEFKFFMGRAHALRKAYELRKSSREFKVKAEISVGEKQKVQRGFCVLLDTMFK